MGSYLSRSSLFYKLNNRTGSAKPVLFISILLLLFTFVPGKLFAGSYVWNGATSNAWATTTNWTPNGNPGSGVGDVVSIPVVGTQPTLSVTPANALTSITFTGVSGTLTITTVTLTVTGAVTLNNSATLTTGCTITGTGTLSCASVAVGSGVVPTANVVTTTMTATISAFTTTGQITLTSNRVNGAIRNNATFTHTSGTVTAAGITTVNSGTPTSTYTMGASSPTLNLTGAIPLTNAGTGTSTYTFNGAGSTVEYSNSTNITFLTLPTAYINLIISGGAGVVKTLAANTTVSTALTIRAGSTLAKSTFTLSTPTSITLETVGGGDGASITGSTGNFTLGGNITVNYTGTGAITTGASITAIVALGASRNITVGDDGSSNIDFTISGVVSGAFGIVKLGDGTLVLSAASTYTGTTTVSAGTLMNAAAVAVSTNGPFGNAASAIIMGNAATTTNGSSPTLLTNGAFNIARTITIANQTTTGTYSIGGNTDNNSTFSGLVTFSQPFKVIQLATTSTNTLTISGGITGGLAGVKIVTFDNIGAVIVSTVAISTGTGTTAVVKQNSGILTMNFANTYTAGTTLTAGTLKLSNVSGLGAAGQAVALNGGILDLATNTTVNAYNITIGGTTTIQSNKATAASAGITHTLGTLSIGAFNPTITGGSNATSGTTQVTFGVTTFTGSPTFTITDGSGTSVAKLSLAAVTNGANTATINGNGDMIQTGVWGNGAGGVIYSGTGILTLSQANTYTGTTTISSGTLNIGASNTVLGTIAGITTIADGAVIDLKGFTVSNAEPLTLNGAGLTALPAGALTNTGGNASYSGPITLGSASTITATVSGTLTASGTFGTGAFDLTLAGAGTGTMSGIISTPTSIIKDEAGTWNLSGVNTYTGATTVNGGTLKAGVATQAFGVTSAVTLANTALVILDITGFANTIGSLTGGGATGGNVTLGAATLTIGSDNTSPAAYAGIISGTGAITKSGTGTLILSGSNTYTGLTTIDVGTLKLGATGGVTNTPLGTTGSGTVVSATGAALDLGGFTLANITTFEALTLNGTGIALGGALMNSGAAATYSGLITLGSASSIIGGTGSIGISHVGTITGSGFGLTLGGVQGGSITSIIGTVTGTVTKEDGGTWTLSGANTYSGGTSLNAGQLNIDHLTAIGSGALTISANTIIDNTSGGAIGPLTNNNIQTWNGDFTFTGTNDLNMGTGAISMGADVTITSSTIAKTLTIGGINNNGTRSLTKAGAGNLTFGSTAVTLNNVTITAGSLTSTSGTLSLAGNFANSSTFTHNSGTVTFNGTGAQSINSGGSSFNNFTITNIGGTCTAVASNITVAVTFTTNASTTLDMATFALSVATVAHSGTLKTQNVSATPITAAKTWGGLVEYNSASDQTVINGTYYDLVISNAGVKTILTATTVNCQTITFNDAATLEIAGTGLFNILG
jgi:fibronectin-binding autotransporter adhesin